MLQQVAPRQMILIQHVDQQVKRTFDIVSSRLVKPSCRVKGSEEEITRKIANILLLNMLTFFVKVLGRETKINQVDL